VTARSETECRIYGNSAMLHFRLHNIPYKPVVGNNLIIFDFGYLYSNYFGRFQRHSEPVPSSVIPIAHEKETEYFRLHTFLVLCAAKLLIIIIIYDIFIIFCHYSRRRSYCFKLLRRPFWTDKKFVFSMSAQKKNKF